MTFFELLYLFRICVICEICGFSYDYEDNNSVALVGSLLPNGCVTAGTADRFQYSFAPAEAKLSGRSRQIREIAALNRIHGYLDDVTPAALLTKPGEVLTDLTRMMKIPL